MPNKSEIAPYVHDESTECWIGEGAFDEAHADFWRISPKGCASLIRGLQEDSQTILERGFEPGTAFDLTVPIRRVGEVLLHAEQLAQHLRIGDSGTLVLRLHYTGLVGRQLVSISKTRHVWEGRVSRQNEITL